MAGEGVIFDVDGVLVDSYEAHRESWRSLARELDRPFSDADFARTFGRTSREIMADVWSEHDAARVRAWDDRKEALYREAVRREFPAMDGARELIAALVDAGFAVGAGSSGPPENVELVLATLGVRDAMAAVVTGFDVQRGKPDPEVFLVAAERMGVAPDRCIVVEDAPAGVEAARHAGMGVVGLCSTGRTPEMLDAADLVVDSLRALTPERFGSLLG